MKLAKMTATGAMFALLAGVLFMTSANFFATPKVKMSVEAKLPVVEIESYAFDSDTVKAGESLVLKFTMTRNEWCARVVTKRHFVNRATDIETWSSVVEPRTLYIGEHQVGGSSLPVPEWVEPGAYKFWAVTANDNCPSGRSYTVVSPMLDFIVVPPTKGDGK